MRKTPRPSSKKKDKEEISYEKRAKQVGVIEALKEERRKFGYDSVKEVK